MIVPFPYLQDEGRLLVEEQVDEAARDGGGVVDP
jgi:hypothetical protein